MDVGSEQLVLRPSNCPHHILIFNAGQHSFRDLPVRLCELGAMFRYERSGVLGGLSRVRAMTLNDAHHLRLSLHGPTGSYVDARAMWQRGETTLRAAIDAADVEWVTAGDRERPVMAVIGDREVADDTLSVRRRDGRPLAATGTNALLRLIADLAATRSLHLDVG